MPNCSLRANALFLTSLMPVFLCCTAARQATGAGQSGSPLELEAIRQVISGIIRADNAGDAAAVMSFYADDSVLLPPNDSPVVGKDAIRSRYEEGFRHFRFDISSTSDETRVFGEWAFDRGTTSGRTIPKESDAARQVHDKYVMILHREVNGSWKIARLIWNRAEPATRPKE
jgi:uncharacterized protein (TIGR02246 family)